MCGDIVMAHRFTGQPGPMRAVQRCAYGSSPGNSGESGAMGGEMSQSFFVITTVYLTPELSQPKVRLPSRTWTYRTYARRLHRRGPGRVVPRPVAEEKRSRARGAGAGARPR